MPITPEIPPGGNYLDGGMSYRLRLPPKAPARNSWSIVLYDPQTPRRASRRVVDGGHLAV